MSRTALSRTKSLLRWKAMILGLSLYLTLFPLTFTFDDGGFRRWFWPEYAVPAVFALLFGAIGWVAFIALGRKLRPSGF